MHDLIGIQFLSTEQVKSLHEEMIEDYGGGLVGIKDLNMLESAVAAPKAFAFGQFLNKSIHEMAAALLIGLASNHGFNDANKRTAAHATATFYGMNGFKLDLKVDEFVEFMVSVVVDKPSKELVAAYLRSKATKIEVPDR